MEFLVKPLFPYDEGSQSLDTPVKLASKKRNKPLRTPPSPLPRCISDFMFLIYRETRLCEMNVNLRIQRIRRNLLMSVCRNEGQIIPISYLDSFKFYVWAT